MVVAVRTPQAQACGGCETVHPTSSLALAPVKASKPALPPHSKMTRENMLSQAKALFFAYVLPLPVLPLAWANQRDHCFPVMFIVGRDIARPSSGFHGTDAPLMSSTAWLNHAFKSIQSRRRNCTPVSTIGAAANA